MPNSRSIAGLIGPTLIAVTISESMGPDRPHLDRWQHLNAAYAKQFGS